jgi:DHA1 family multidrug resistance protein-like MFS transporter
MMLEENLNNSSVSWRKNLYIIAAAEFIAILGFSLFNPFLPLYMQKIGNFGSSEAALWSGIATGGAGLAMFLSSPFWGMAADRWGRKPMLLRAQFGGAVVVALYILAPNIFLFVFFRVLQGLFTGTVSAASALVATCTPRDKLPVTMGTLLGAVFAGFTIGPLLGGFLAETIGYEATFGVTAVLLLIGGLIILFFTKENFQRPAAGKGTSLSSMLRLAGSREVLPLLMVLGCLNLGPQIVQPILALVFGEVAPSESAARAAGMAFGLMGIITALSSVVVGRISRGYGVRKIMIICCIGTGLLYLPLIWANSSVQLIIMFGLTGLLTGGIMTSSNSLVGLAVPIAQQGIAYGLSQSANSLGSGLGPFIGGGLAPLIGFRHIFGVTAAVFIVVGLLCNKLLPQKKEPGTKTQ